MLKILVVLLAFVAVPAWAQQAQAPTPTEQALTGKLMEEIGANIQLRTSVIQLQQQVQALTKQIADKEKK